MMHKKSLNRVVLVGRAGKDPEVRATKDGVLVVCFSLATNEVRAKKEHTEWHNIVAWGKLAEFVEEYIKKGQLICIEGSIYTRKWTDKKGVIHSVAEIFANSAVPLEWKK
ncbi:MAG: hypothetical protein CMG00_05515 [Candidatus Marinimicrobia bacterium]|nr:hypothetical protein [Candidatus Neomarinimicrobiota bacterium]